MDKYKRINLDHKENISIECKNINILNIILVYELNLAQNLKFSVTNFLKF